MMPEQKKIKAVALISGGLDSLLATKVILDQGIHVEGINFYTGFCVEGHTQAIRNQDREKAKRNNALWVADQLNIKLHIEDIVDEYKDVLLNPKYGYGTNMNPCLDCKIFMVKKAKEWMIEHDFDFIITGEVVGQRLKSQKKVTMPIIAQQSGAEERLVRPLCAKLLPATYPEKMGWIHREKLYGFSGRSRTPQIALAAQYGFDDYSQPAGGCCVLTNEAYSTKLVDMWSAWEKVGKSRDYTLNDIILLKVGRHLRPDPAFKLIIARDEGESNFLLGFRKRYTSLQSVSCKGPLTLIDGAVTLEQLNFAAQMVARYSKDKHADTVDIEIKPFLGDAYTLNVKPLSEDQIKPEWYV
jgi:tRNA-specific 2-thiouridylase